MRKSGFTIAEFIICLMIMFIIMGSVVTIPFKKAKLTQNVQLRSGEIIWDCNTTAPDLKTGTSGGGQYAYCEFTIDNPTGKDEFFTVQLVGGGAAASTEIGGRPGEEKEIIYPSMTGKYRIYLGIGGEYHNNSITVPRNGGATVLYKVLESGSLELMDFAAGGSASMETLHDFEVSGGATKESLAIGVTPHFVTNPGMKICGAGGNAPSYGSTQNDGIMGGARISW